MSAVSTMTALSGQVSLIDFITVIVKFLTERQSVRIQCPALANEYPGFSVGPRRYRFELYRFRWIGRGGSGHRRSRLLGKAGDHAKGKSEISQGPSQVFCHRR